MATESKGESGEEREGAPSSADSGKARIMAVAGLVLSALFIGMTFFRLRYGPKGIALEARMNGVELLQALGGLKLGAGLLFVLLTSATLPLRAWRWGLVVAPRGNFADRFHATTVGFMAINLLPARIGEITRGMVLASRLPELGRTRAVGSVVLVRLLDLVALALIALPLPLLLFPEEEKQGILGAGLFLLILLSAGSLLLVHLARWHGKRAGAWISRHLGEKAGGLFAQFCAGMGPNLSLARMIGAIFATVAVQLVSALAYAPVIADLCPGLEPLSASVLALAAVSLSLAIPSAPSGVGLYHFALAWSLQAIGANAADAAAVAIVTHLGSIVAFVIPGAISLLVTGMPVSALWGKRG